MTEAQTIQYQRFLDAGYDPADARIMIDRGAWLSTPEMSAETVADIKRYRTERERQDADIEAALCALAAQAQELDMGY